MIYNNETLFHYFLTNTVMTPQNCYKPQKQNKTLNFLNIKNITNKWTASTSSKNTLYFRKLCVHMNNICNNFAFILLICIHSFLQIIFLNRFSEKLSFLTFVKEISLFLFSGIKDRPLQLTHCKNSTRQFIDMDQKTYTHWHTKSKHFISVV